MQLVKLLNIACFLQIRNPTADTYGSTKSPELFFDLLVFPSSSSSSHIMSYFDLQYIHFFFVPFERFEFGWRAAGTSTTGKCRVSIYL